MVIILILSLLRIIGPLLIFRKPWWGICLALALDAIDTVFFPFSQGYSYSAYEQWDKLMDVYMSVVFALYLSSSWTNVLSKRVALFLLIFRLSGVTIFELSAWRPILFFFPNVFDSFFIFTEFCRKVVGRYVPVISKANLIISLTVLTVLKLVQEYLIHIAGYFPWQSELGKLVIGDGWLYNYSNVLIWASFFVLLHFVTLLVMDRGMTRLD